MLVFCYLCSKFIFLFVKLSKTHKNYKYLPYIQALFITVLLIVNLVAAGKVTFFQFKEFSFPFGAGILFFPISYLIGDLLTEVYGYAPTRRVIWTSFAVLILANIMVQLILLMPPDQSWPHQKAYQEVFSTSWRLAFSSIIAFSAGEFTNSFVLAKLKVLTNGSKLWARTIGSTICGEAIDTLIFYPLAFFGNPDFSVLLILSLMKVNYICKIVWEVLATPLTYLIVNWLKKAEHEDYFDRKTDFNPFKLEEA